ncbi:hypothetical protein FPANT_2442 [Fusarium pseudoanthophilum]|uniref:Uncharacterized protein n=1 Tax=Fusarium pseudoanthophilum TaxID=48495 RepID=A0A8H5PQ31_9HYPO|nr:hypothetical protein FPANT_2442 [Fusarium pseudoanthophilum]
MAFSSNPKIFDHSSIDYVKIGPRRAHMKAFFLHLGLWNEEKVKIFREFAEEKSCELVYGAGHDQVNQVFFEYMVDQIVWFNLIKDRNALDQGHDWPWTPDALPDKTDVTTDGPSGYFKCWLRYNLQSKAPTSHQGIAGAPSNDSNGSETAPVQQTPEPAFEGQARLPLAEQQSHDTDSSIWAPKPPANNSVDISRVATAFADINLGIGEEWKGEGEGHLWNRGI